jgi:hypothetical protein
VKQLLTASVHSRCIVAKQTLIVSCAPKTRQGSSDPWLLHQAWPHAPTPICCMSDLSQKAWLSSLLGAALRYWRMVRCFVGFDMLVEVPVCVSFCNSLCTYFTENYTWKCRAVFGDRECKKVTVACDVLWRVLGITITILDIIHRPTNTVYWAQLKTETESNVRNVVF